MIYALKKWRHCLLVYKFKIFTDNKSLKYLFTQKELNMRQYRWLKYVKDYDCNIEYSTDQGNSVANALSRKYTGLVKGGDSKERTEENDVMF